MASKETLFSINHLYLTVKLKELFGGEWDIMERDGTIRACCNRMIDGKCETRLAEYKLHKNHSGQKRWFVTRTVPLTLGVPFAFWDDLVDPTKETK